MFAPFPRDQAGDSLPSPQFAIKQDAQAGERIPELADFEEVGWIPRPARKFKLRARVSLQEQNTIGAKRARYLWKERSLQILKAKDQGVAALWKTDMLQIRLHQLEAPVQMSLGRRKEALSLPHRHIHAVRPHFQSVQSNLREIHRRDMLSSRGKK